MMLLAALAWFMGLGNGVMAQDTVDMVIWLLVCFKSLLGAEAEIPGRNAYVEWATIYL